MSVEAIAPASVSLVREHDKERLDASDSDVLVGLVQSFVVRMGDANFSLSWHRAAFRRFAAPRADGVEEITFCHACDVAFPDDSDGTWGKDEWYCESCMNDRLSCNDCDDVVVSWDSYSVNDYYNVCQSCYDSNFSYCDDCDVNYRDSDSDEHQHTGDGCCEPLRTTFLIRNDGEAPLANDTRVTITLPSGTVDSEGINRIARLLSQKGYEIRQATYDRVYAETHDWSAAADAVTKMDDVNALMQASRLVHNMDPRWQLKDGNFTKRLSRGLYKQSGLKLPAEIVSEIGNIARQHTADTAAFNIETTRELNLSAGDFYHEGSCWWGGYGDSRCTLKTNGGFGLRTFDADGDVSGRAWVMPMKGEADNLTPTFDTETPSAFVVFNCYGDLSGYTAARILAHMAGWTYRKIAFTGDPMYINDNSGYLVAPEDTASHFTDGGLSLHLNQHSNLDSLETSLALLQSEETVNA